MNKVNHAELIQAGKATRFGPGWPGHRCGAKPRAGGGMAEGAGLSFAEAMLCQTRGALPHPSSDDKTMEELASETYRRAAAVTEQSE